MIRQHERRQRNRLDWGEAKDSEMIGKPYLYTTHYYQVCVDFKHETYLKRDFSSAFVILMLIEWEQWKQF